MDTVNQEKPTKLEIEPNSDLEKSILHILNRQMYESDAISQNIYFKAKRKINELK